MRDLSNPLFLTSSDRGSEESKVCSIFSAINGSLSKISRMSLINRLTPFAWIAAASGGSFAACGGLTSSSKRTNSSYNGKVSSWKATTGRVGESPAPVWKPQYWFTLKGILGSENGAVATAGVAKSSMGFAVFTML